MMPQQALAEKHLQTTHGSSSGLLDWCGVKGKLYDRSVQTEQLLRSYLRQTSATSVEQNHTNELVLIEGPAGCGKTVLGLTLKDRVEQDRGFFCRGKFNQPAHFSTASGPSSCNTATDSAHGPFATALSQWASLKVKCGGAEDLEQLQTTLERDLDRSELHILIRSIPGLKQIVNKTTLATTWLGLQGPDAEMRYNEILLKFIGAICGPSQPLVVLLDDLQWADQSSLELMKTLVSRQVASTGFMLMATVRSEVDSSPPLLAEMLTELTTKGVVINHVKVSNFSEDTVATLVSDILHRSVQDTLPLSHAIYQQTDGNAFFVFQLLSCLEVEGSLNDSVNDHNVDDNFYTTVPSVLVLATKKTQQLPSSVQDVLKIAACMGAQVSERLLTEACSVGLTSLTVKPAIKIAHEQGLVIYDQSAGMISFIHDVMQQAVYSLIPENKRPALHLHIGRSLWIWLPRDELVTNIFFITNQISHGLHLLEDQVEKEDLAELFLNAGQQAAMSSAFSQALRYYEIGMSLLGRRHWKNQYRLSLDLYNAAAEMEYYGGNLERLDLLIASVLKHAKSLDEKLNAYYTQIYSLGSRDNMQLALSTGLVVLEQLGVAFPKNMYKVRTNITEKLCLQRLRKMSDDAILNLPIMHEKRQLMIIRLMNILFIPAYSARPELVVPMVMRMVNYTLDHGICGASCIGFGHLGHHIEQRGHTEEGCRWVRLGLRIMEKFDSQEWHSRLAQALYGGFYTMRHPVRESINPLLAAHRAGLVVGDIHSSLVCASFRCRISLCASVPLPELIGDIRKYRTICTQYGQRSADMILSHQEQFCLNFMGKAADPVALTGEVINEEDTMRALLGNHPYALTWFFLMKHMLAVYFNEPQKAKVISSHFRTLKVEKAILPISLATHLFLEGITAALLSRVKRSELRRAQRICKQIASYQTTSPENFTNKIRLLEAEIAAVNGDRKVALLKYDESREAALKEGFLHEQALACERAGYKLLEWGRLSNAVDYLKQACSIYECWGASAKVEQVQNCINCASSSSMNQRT